MSSRTYLSIGDVLTLLREEFPDVTISKIRFLESQGLVNPERSPSGYRKFFEPDVERLRWVLRQQREHFLPLKVIRDRLAAGDLGDIEVEPGVETEAEPARRNGAASHPAHSTPDGSERAEEPATSMGSSAGRTTPPSPASGGQRRGSANAAAGRTEAQMAQADNEAMARILADASRRAALIPENAADRAPLHVVPDAGHSTESESVARARAPARGDASPSVVANEGQGQGRTSESSPARPVGAKHAAVDSSPTSAPFRHRGRARQRRGRRRLVARAQRLVARAERLVARAAQLMAQGRQPVPRGRPVPVPVLELGQGRPARTIGPREGHRPLQASPPAARRTKPAREPDLQAPPTRAARAVGQRARPSRYCTPDMVTGASLTCRRTVRGQRAVRGRTGRAAGFRPDRAGDRGGNTHFRRGCPDRGQPGRRFPKIRASSPATCASTATPSTGRSG